MVIVIPTNIFSGYNSEIHGVPIEAIASASFSEGAELDITSCYDIMIDMELNCPDAFEGGEAFTALYDSLFGGVNTIIREYLIEHQCYSSKAVSLGWDIGCISIRV